MTIDSAQTGRTRDESSGTEPVWNEGLQGWFYRKDPFLKAGIGMQTVKQGIITMTKEARDNYLLPTSIPGKNNNYQ